MYTFKRTLGGLARLWAYAPIVFRSQEWDHSFLLELMEFKMGRMKKYHETAEFRLPKQRDKIVRQISICIELLRREQGKGVQACDEQIAFDEWLDWPDWLGIKESRSSQYLT